MTTVRRSMLIVALVLGLVAGTAASATAEVSGRQTAPAEALERVLAEVEAGTPYHALSPRERGVLDAHVLVAREGVERVELRPATSGATATGADDGESPGLLSICVIGRVVYSALASAGNTLYTYFVEGTWCSDGVTVETATHEWSGGEASGPGWTYHGVLASGGGVRANEGRAWSGHRFTLDIAGFTVQTEEPCVRMRGSADGTLGHDGVCGLD